MTRTLLVALALLALSTPARAEGWALEEWLAEPDVKLVAVEFYADWCEPCKESAPRWEALRKRYAPQGLKLVVVNLSEKPGGGKRCTRLPWNPDESICDPSLGEKLGVTELPEAFVWSWQGNLLVDRGKHVDEIERVIRRYLDDNPRVSVVATNTMGKPDKVLQRMVEAKINESGKLTVVPDAQIRKRLAKVRKESHSAGRRDDQRCVLGAEVSANSLVTVERFPGAIALTLADAETGCQKATVSAPWEDGRPAKAVQKGVFKLMRRIEQRQVVMPKGALPLRSASALRTPAPAEPPASESAAEPPLRGAHARRGDGEAGAPKPGAHGEKRSAQPAPHLQVASKGRGWCKQQAPVNACGRCGSDADCGGMASSCWAERSPACDGATAPAAPTPARSATTSHVGWCKQQAPVNSCGRCSSDADCGGVASSCWAKRSPACAGVRPGNGAARAVADGESGAAEEPSERSLIGGCWGASHFRWGPTFGLMLLCSALLRRRGHEALACRESGPSDHA